MAINKQPPITISKDDHHEGGGHFIIPFDILAKVCGALLFLTVLTVATSRLNLGMFAGPVAFLIAFVKAMLVVSYFMGLKYDTKENRIAFAMSFVFLGIMMFFCVIDIATRVFQNSTL